MFINPIGESDPYQKGVLIHKLAHCGVTKEVFLSHTPGLHNTFGVALIDHDECVSARIAMNKQEVEWLTSDAIYDPVWYCFLSWQQIAKIDPHCGEVLEQKFKIQFKELKIEF